MHIRLTFVEGRSARFYELGLDGSDLHIRFGRVGTAGRAQMKPFASPEEAQAELDKLVAQKKSKGYVEAPDEDGVEVSRPKETPARALKAHSRKMAKAEGPKEPALPRPALDDPEVPGLTLVRFEAHPLPVPHVSAAAADTTHEAGIVIEGYRLLVEPKEGGGDEVVVIDPKGKRLKSVPAKVKKSDSYQTMMRGRKDDRLRPRRARFAIENRMVAGLPFTAEEMAWLSQDLAYGPHLRGLIFAPEGQSEASMGVIVRFDEQRGLGLVPLDYDSRWVPFSEGLIPHPIRMPSLSDWQDLIIDLGLEQPIPQVFRELRRVQHAERRLKESSLLAGGETRSAAAIERLLMEAGWTVKRGLARRKLSARVDARPAQVEAWFDYGEFYTPDEPTFLGNFGFADVATKRRLTFEEVPEIIVSEAIRSLETCAAQAGAKKAEENEIEEDHDDDEATPAVGSAHG